MLPDSFPRRGLVAHRGLAASVPENTIAALRAAVTAGAPVVEFDLQCTVDGVPVLLHDRSLERTAGAALDITELTLAEARAHPVGHPAGHPLHGRMDHAGAAGQPLETLAEAVAVLAGLDAVCSLVEVKGESVERFGLRSVLDAVLPAIEPLRGTAAVISFEADVVAASRAQGWPVGLCLEPHDAGGRARAAELRPDLLLTDERTWSDEQRPWSGPWRHACWEVVDPARAVELLRLGIDYVETMAADRLLADARLRAVLT